MATTSPDNIWTPDAGDAYALTTDLAAMADTVQDALTDIRTDNLSFAGLESAKPVAGVEGRTWYSTDINRHWFDDGTTWLSVDPGSYLLTPTSATNGTVAGGHITPTSGQTVLTVNGVFSSRFRAYKIVADLTFSAVAGVSFQLCAAGSPSTTGYYSQYLYSSGATVGGSYAPNTASLGLTTYSGLGAGHEILLQRPGTATDTYYSVASNAPTAGMWTAAGFHQPATAYDGFRLTTSAGNFTGGNLAVYGLA